MAEGVILEPVASSLSLAPFERRRLTSLPLDKWNSPRTTPDELAWDWLGEAVHLRWLEVKSVQIGLN